MMYIPVMILLLPIWILLSVATFKYVRREKVWWPFALVASILVAFVFSLPLAGAIEGLIYGFK